ncbi:hypothetical protein GGP41_003706, partial [Bipolaris sorokiniana]
VIGLELIFWGRLRSFNPCVWAEYELQHGVLVMQLRRYADGLAEATARRHGATRHGNVQHRSARTFKLSRGGSHRREFRGYFSTYVFGLAALSVR